MVGIVASFRAKLTFVPVDRRTEAIALRAVAEHTPADPAVSAGAGTFDALAHYALASERIMCDLYGHIVSSGYN
jgi:hypothetical protein